MSRPHCPDWCAGGHRCQPDLREHRSEPWTIHTRYGQLVATRVRQRGRDRLEIRALVDLPVDQPDAAELAQLVLVDVDRAIRRLVATVRA